MMKTFSLLICLLILCQFIVAGKPCDTGWFGSKCQYKCHCTGDRCNNNGDCREGYSCEKGWLGPACQYQDLLATTFNGRSWLAYGDDISRKINRDQQIATFTFRYTFPFTWLRIQLNDTVASHNISLRFTRSFSRREPCEDMRTAVVSQNMLDIHCKASWATSSVNSVTLTGESVTFLSSVYISGGRNLALRQNTSQSTTAGASLAVDGNTDDGECTRAKEGDDKPTWSVVFSCPQLINRVVYYGTYRGFSTGLQTEGFAKNGTQLFKYPYDSRYRNDIYYTFNIYGPAVSKVLVGSKTSKYLNLCEMEMFGDSACQPGRYGRECEHTCNCAVRTESCFVSTGGCPSGCAAGYYGEDCQEGGEDTVVIFSVGVGVAICFLATIVVVFGVYWYRRKSKNGQVRPPGYDVVDTSRQDVHSYRSINQSDDGYSSPTEPRFATTRHNGRILCGAIEQSDHDYSSPTEPPRYGKTRQEERNTGAIEQPDDGYSSPTEPRFVTARQDERNGGPIEQSDDGYIAPADPYPYYTEIIDDSSVSSQQNQRR